MNSNRLSKSDSTPNSGDCVAGVSTSRTGLYNAADQQMSSTVETTVDGDTQSTTGSYIYDALGRTTTLPAVDSPNGVATEFTYFADDQVASQKQGSTVMSWTRDPEERAVTWSTAGGGGTAAPNGTNHYAGEGDSPAWTSNGTTITRFFGGIDGGLALTSVNEGPDAGTTLSIVNPHGDIAATVKNVPDAGLGDVESENETDEYGNSLTGSAPTTYGWEGAAQRSRNTLSGLTLMGVRQYNPVTGRFLSLDPVEGGTENAYTYPVDPVNGGDLDGQVAWFIPVVLIVVRVAIRVAPKVIKWARQVPKAAKAVGKRPYGAGLSSARKAKISISRINMPSFNIKIPTIRIPSIKIPKINFRLPAGAYGRNAQIRGLKPGKNVQKGIYVAKSERHLKRIYARAVRTGTRSVSNGKVWYTNKYGVSFSQRNSSGHGLTLDVTGHDFIKKIHY